MLLRLNLQFLLWFHYIFIILLVCWILNNYAWWERFLKILSWYYFLFRYLLLIIKNVFLDLRLHKTIYIFIVVSNERVTNFNIKLTISYYKVINKLIQFHWVRNVRINFVRRIGFVDLNSLWTLFQRKKPILIL